MERRSVQTGAVWESRVGYARAVRVGGVIAVTGTMAVGADGAIVGVGDAYAQARTALERIVGALTELGASAPDVIRTRIYVVDIERDWEAIGRAHAEVFGEIRPATSMVEVSRLILPEALVEIEADAVVGG